MEYYANVTASRLADIRDDVQIITYCVCILTGLALGYVLSKLIKRYWP